MKRTAGVFALTLLAVVVVVLLLQSGNAIQAATRAQTLTLDVACDGNTFMLNRVSQSAASIHRGDAYVVNGTIYAGGTIPSGGTDAEPSAFGPDQPGGIGMWIARGTFLVAGKEFSTEKIQRASTHYFVLSDKNRLFTEGFEGSVDINRAIIGGVGEYAGAGGLVTMERLGTNSTGAYNLRFTFVLE